MSMSKLWDSSGDQDETSVSPARVSVIISEPRLITRGSATVFIESSSLHLLVHNLDPRTSDSEGRKMQYIVTAALK